MRSQPTTPAAPAQGAAEQAAARHAALLATLACLDEQAAHAAKGRGCYSLAPASAHPDDNPATDPARWAGFL